jgi:uncharacterized membrane protein YjjB (DUF3815 family)
VNWWMSLWAAPAVLGFAMVFSVPRRTLPGIVALAVAAHLLRSFALHQGAGLPVASFAAALFVGFTAAVVAPRMGQATSVYAFAPVIPLIPGTFMFEALTGLLDLTTGDLSDASAQVDTAVVDATIATMTIIALAVGTIGPTLLAGRRIARLAHIEVTGLDG